GLVVSCSSIATRPKFSVAFGGNLIALGRSVPRYSVSRVKRGWGAIMRRLSFALISALSIVAFTQIASAADMPVKAPAPPPLAGGSFWAEAEYLYWQTKGDGLPALVTTGVTGVLGAPGTSVLFGQSTVNDDWRSGVRVRAGYWFDP